MIKITFEAGSFDEAFHIIDSLRERAARLAAVQAAPGEAPAAPGEAPAEPVEAPAKRGPGRPRKAEQLAHEQPAPVAQPAPSVLDPTPDALPWTPAERHASLLAYYNDEKHGGSAKSIALLQRHGAVRFSDLKPEQFAAFDAMLLAASAGEYDPTA